MAETMCNMLSKDGESFSVPLKVAKMSSLVKTMCDDEAEAGDVQEFPMSNVSTEILSKVIEYMKRMDSDPMPEIEKPLRSNDITQICPEWYSNFVKVDQEVLFELILAANYMELNTLLDLTCASVTCMIKGHTPEEIRETFKLTVDFTPEEEQQIRLENKWCEEA